MLDAGVITQIGAGVGAAIGGGFAAWQSKRARHEMNNGFRTSLVNEIAARVEKQVDERIDSRFETYERQSGEVLAAHLKISHAGGDT